MKLFPLLALALATTVTGFAAVEEAIDSRFKPAAAYPVIGDWQGSGGIVAQVNLD